MLRLLVAYLLGHALISAVTMPIWRDDVTLWSHAVAAAPRKPRPTLNLARALILTGQLDQAETLLLRTLALAAQPHVPGYDRADAVSAATANLQTVAIVRAIGGVGR